MPIHRWVPAALLVAAGVTNSPLRADDSDETRMLKNRIEELDKKVRLLERKMELDQEAAAASAATAASVTAGAHGFTIRSADTNFLLRVRGYVQADARFYPDDHAAGTVNDTFLLRRVRPIFEGTV